MAVFFINTAFSFSPPTDSLRKEYVEEYPDKFYLKPIYTIRNLGLQLNSRTSPSKINYSPNGNSYFGLGVYIFNLGVEASLRLPQNSKRQSRFGKTEFFDFQSNIYSKRWGADLAIQKYDGFYLSNPMQHIPGWKVTDNYPQREDLTIHNISADAFYIFNHTKFSYRSAYNQADRQKRSGGSFIAGINFLDQKISSDSTLIPLNSRTNFEIDEFYKAEFTGIGFSGGYTYSVVYKYFYLNLSLSAGPMHLWSKFAEDDREISDNFMTPLFQVRTALGYNRPRWFAGLSLVQQTTNVTTDYMDIRREFGNLKFFLGYRFEEVGLLKKDLFKFQR